MKLCCIVLTLLFSTGISQSQNILGALELKSSAKTERKVLKKFRKLNCYTERVNYKIQPVYYLEFKYFEDGNLTRIEDSVLTNESLFLKNLLKPKRRIAHIIGSKSFKHDMVSRYIIYNDSLQPVGSTYGNTYNYTAFCAYKIDHYNDLQYAMANQYIIFDVENFPMKFGYKDGKLYIFETELQAKGNFNVYPFEEFDWEQSHLLQWRTFLQSFDSDSVVPNAKITTTKSYSLNLPPVIVGRTGPNVVTVFPFIRDINLENRESKLPIIYPLLIVNDVPIRDEKKLNCFRNHFDRTQIKKIKIISQAEAGKKGIPNVPKDGVLFVTVKKGYYFDFSCE